MGSEAEQTSLLTVDGLHKSDLPENLETTETMAEDTKTIVGNKPQTLFTS
jgi:hypothetical protein